MIVKLAKQDRQTDRQADSSARATAWSITINNPTADDDNALKSLPQGWTVHGQKERGENGTEHYQILLKTPQVRFSTVKKLLGRAHIEVCRNPQALMQYVNKEETRVAPLAVETRVTFDQIMYEVSRVFIAREQNGCFSEPLDHAKEALLSFDSICNDYITKGDTYVADICVNPFNRSKVKICIQGYVGNYYRLLEERNAGSFSPSSGPPPPSPVDPSSRQETTGVSP